MHRFLPDAFREARRAAKLTQTDLAGRAGVHINVIARAEQGRHVPAAEALAAIADALGVDLRTLFDTDEVPA